MTALFDCLDDDQVEVMRWGPDDSNLRVVAAAGSGKTTTVTALVAKLILVDEVTPSDICVLTFAAKAAQELTERLTQVVGHSAAAQLRVGTFHAVGLDFLRKGDPAPWVMNRCMDLPTGSRAPDVPSAVQLYRSVLVFGTVPGTNETSLRVADIPDLHLHHIQLQRADGRDVTKAKPVREAKELVTAWAMAERAKGALKAWEFDDVMLAWRKELAARPEGCFRVVIVDEAQDNNRIQGEIAQALAGTRGRIVLVGDLRQTVHEWRGAYPKLFAEAHTTLKAETRELPFNYRSRPAIISLCNAYASGMPWSLGRNVKATREATSHGVECQVYPDHYAQGVAIATSILREMQAGQHKTRAVLCRTHGLLATMEAAFVAAGVTVYMATPTSLFRGMAARQVIEYLRAVCMGDATAAAVIANVPKRFIPRNFLSALTSEPAKPGETLGRKISRLATSGNWTRAAKTAAYEFAHVIESAERAPWHEQITAIERILHSAQDDVGEAHETDTWAVAQAVLTLARRCAGFSEFDFFVKKIESMPAVRARQGTDGVTLSTVHRAKGLEWDDVYVDVTEGMLPHHRVRGPALGEEQRLLYVAMSRARERLYLSAAAETYTPQRAGGKSSLLGRVEHLLSAPGEAAREDVEPLAPEPPSAELEATDEYAACDDEMVGPF
jgi:superfamily I DNA/RNA helicase